ncbi:MAG TPA: protease modulator HflC [Clostridiales bacterium]|nr:protease modulator HflC [Clostridiales bacterium]
MKNKKKIINTIIMFLFVIGLITLFSSMVITSEKDFTLIKRFGKIEKIIDTPGLSFKTPFIESATVLPKNLMFYDMQESDVITRDKKTMVADNYVIWKIIDPLIFAKSLNSSIILAESRIDTTVYNALKNVISSLNQTEVISGRDGELSDAIMKEIGGSMIQYGVDLIVVETKHLDLPSDNKTAVFERMISERAQMAATYTAEGESEAQMIRNITDKEIAISLSNAEKDAAKLIAEGEAEYMRILSEAFETQEKSEFYTFMRSLESSKSSLVGDNKTLILSPSSPIADVFYNID